ncbi:MAG: peptidoglycan DD-metalloendopeptidase family protein [Bacteroidales bacterium]|jgi:septal ring factor EnvC (AmiA/AmiB activator)|nr:peptidoglycan DD-metalloendopeptidase family protein [Bacteroidales bacterium]
MQKQTNIFIWLSLTVFVFLFGTQGFSQSKEDLEAQKRKTYEQIQKTSKLLDETKQGRKKTYNNLLLLNEQIDSRKSLIQKISEEVNFLDEKISENEETISGLQSDLDELKAAYARMIQHAYRIKNSQDRLIFILSADDFNQAYKRLAYLRELAKFRRLQAEAIVNTKEEIIAKNLKLDSTKQEQLNLLTDQEQEAQKLNSEIIEKNDIIENLKSKEQELRSQLQAQKQRADKLQREIERLIAEEAKRSSSEGYAMTPEEKLISKEFGNNKGRLPWPVASGVITGKFGKQAHPVLRGVYINNNGVDISTSKGSIVRSIFNGEVRKVFKVPGYQNAIIIRHGNYLSTYTHLESVYVSVGDKVSAKQSIGSIHTDVNSGETVVHMEVWYGQKVLNPEQWLAK